MIHASEFTREGKSLKPEACIGTPRGAGEARVIIGPGEEGEMASPPAARCWDEWRARRLASFEERALARSFRPVEPENLMMAEEMGTAVSAPSATPGASPVEVRVAPDTLARWLANDQDLGHSHEPSTSIASTSSRSSSSSTRVRLFSSNDYLGMSTHSAVRIAAARAALAHGSGPRSSALVCGYTPEHSKLERALASLKGTEECILFSSGYAANCGVIPALCDDATCEIFSDALNHASIVDGCALAKRKGTRVTLYPHGDTSALSRLVRESRAKRIMVITDSLFSMDGDFAPLIEITSMKREENARCGRARVMVMVDEAHATLVCGKGGNGGGAASMFGVEADVDVSIGTMSKAIGSHGGFVACSGTMKRVLASSARSAIFSTSLPAPVIAAASAALALDRSVGQEARTKLYARIDAFAAACAGRIRSRHVATTCGHMTDDAVNEWRGVFVTRKSPVVSVVVGSESVALSASAELLRRGFHVPAIRPPTVPANTCRLRVALSASHGLEDVRELASAVGDLVSGDAVGSAATAKL